MKQYIITEEMVQCIEVWTEKYPIVSKDIALVIRSHPYNPQAERDKVLNDFVLWNDTCEIFHIVQDYKRHLRQSNDGKPIFISCNTPAHAFRLDLKKDGE